MDSLHAISFPVDLIPRWFGKQKQHSSTLREQSAEQRIRKLRRMRQWIKRHRSSIQDAIYQDFQKPRLETNGSEILVILQEINHTIKHLKEWTQPTKVETPLILSGTSSWVQYEPKGVCLIISPWNYPFQLLVSPWISAIAAGNCCILKPSEMSPYTSELIFEMAAALFHPEEALVVQGDKEVAEALLQYPFDHIFFTGSTAVGKVIMKAAAEHLTSVTLELGGKSPTLVDKSANIEVAARKIAWGKFMNAGQTCIAPDYLLVQESVYNRLVGNLKNAIQKFYQTDGRPVAESPDYARIINQKHFERLRDALEEAVTEGAKVVIGGQHQEDSLFLAPTVLTSVPEDCTLMQEEIFGPILPIKKYSTLEEAVDFINSRPKPLAQYIFSEKKRAIEYVIQHTSAGGMSVNDVVLHIVQPNLPFGGVNHSGIGKSHGHYGFLEFSNQKAVLEQNWGNTIMNLYYPPYTEQVKGIMDKLLRWF